MFVMTVAIWAAAPAAAEDTIEAVAPAVAPPVAVAYADIRGTGADAYASIADLRAGVVDRHVPGTTFVATRGKTVRVARVTYHKTDQGWIAAAALLWKTPSEFVGLELPAPATSPFAWVLPKKRGETVPVLAAPARDAAEVRALARRELVTVLEDRGDHSRIGPDEWVESARLRVVRPAPRPDVLAADARWIDIDLDQQVLVAYQGDTPVFATLVSTGRKKWRTPPGVYRIHHKLDRTRMRSPDGLGQAWNVADVPWAMTFRKHFALHGAYWHDGFGVARSHGCVNLSVGDARRIYDWTSPAVAAGERAADAPLDGGTVIRIRDRRSPQPPWRDFEGKRIDPAVAAP